MIYFFIFFYTILLALVIQGIFGPILSAWSEILYEKARKMEIENDILEMGNSFDEDV